MEPVNLGLRCFVFAMLLYPIMANADELQLQEDPYITAACAGIVSAQSALVSLEEASKIVSSSFEELRRLSKDSDELLGNFDSAIGSPDGAPRLEQIPSHEKLLDIRAKQHEIVERLREIYFQHRSEYLFLLLSTTTDPKISSTERAAMRTSLFVNGLLPFYREFEAHMNNAKLAPEGLQELSEALRSGLESESSAGEVSVPSELKQLEQMIFEFNDAWNDSGDSGGVPSNAFDQEFQVTKSKKPTYCPASDDRGDISGSRFNAGNWALTFDDGPHLRVTPRIHRLLHSYGLKATFFWVTDKAVIYPDLVEKALQMGFEGGGHSQSHPDLTTVSDGRLFDEVICGTQKLQVIARKNLQFFRLPYGKNYKNFSRERKMIADGNKIHVYWTVDSNDWKSHIEDKNGKTVVYTSRMIFESVKLQMEGQARRGRGGVILFHDTDHRTTGAVDLLARTFRGNNNVQFVKLDEAATINDRCQ